MVILSAKNGGYPKLSILPTTSLIA